MVNFDQILGTCLGHPTGDGTILGRSRRRDLRRLRQAHHDAAVDYGRHRLDAQRQEARSVSRHVLPVWRLRRAAYRRRSVSSAESCRPAIKSPGTAVIRAIVSLLVGVLLVSSGVAPVGTIGPANASPASAADAKPLAARSRPEIQ